MTSVCLCVVRAPAEILRVDVEYPCPGHSSWSSSPQMRDLEEETHGGRQTDPLVTGKSQNLHSGEGEKVYLIYTAAATCLYIVCVLWVGLYKDKGLFKHSDKAQNSLH